MIRFLIIASATALLTSPSLAQSHQSQASVAVCEQVRQAIAEYGYAAVKQYALAHFGAAAVVKYGSRCLMNARWKKE